MSRTDTIFVGPNLTATTRPANLILGDIKALSVDMGAYCGAEDTLIDSASWSVVDGQGVISLGTSATSTKVTSCPVTAADIGTEVVQASVAMDNGEVIVSLFRCSVTDPQYVAGSVDRYCD